MITDQELAREFFQGFCILFISYTTLGPTLLWFCAILYNIEKKKCSSLFLLYRSTQNLEIVYIICFVRVWLSTLQTTLFLSDLYKICCNGLWEAISRTNSSIDISLSIVPQKIIRRPITDLNVKSCSPILALNWVIISPVVWYLDITFIMTVDSEFLFDLI